MPPNMNPRKSSVRLGGLGESIALFEIEKAGLASVEESLDPKTEWCSWEDDSSSSWDDDGDNLFANSKEPGMRKKKRKTMTKIESFLEGLTMRIMEKQEQMHKELIELVEKRERERIVREETWKQQEMERIKREEEMRRQEMSRNIALISFIQNALGHEIEPLQPGPVSFVEENEAKDFGNHTENDIMCDPKNRRFLESFDSSRRWPEAEVQALIMLRTASEHKFRMMGSKCSIWDEISVGMHNMGYDRSAKKCKEKWENMNKYFRKSMGNGKKHPENSKACPYFHDLDILYRNGLDTSGNSADFTNYDNVPKIEKE
ncbi:trihelix transcription factor GTL1-like [Mangifera indica]|uniref:trihelix transcription factor GTL1-like n=1 Tax=Mangifera indica TaxID=29780 RepID=UPI001CFAE499|nr:trihelix transcription factor GTL1-like [Mangifera indica]